MSHQQQYYKDPVSLCPYTCPICGKMFYALAGSRNWAYKVDNKKVCSWRCLRKSERIKEKEKEEIKKQLKRRR